MTVERPHGFADERTMLLGRLGLYRDVMVMKIEALSEEQARFKPTPDANSLLTLIVHLTATLRRMLSMVPRPQSQTG